MPSRSSRRSRVRSKRVQPRRSRSKKGGRPRRSRVRTKKGGWSLRRRYISPAASKLKNTADTTLRLQVADDAKKLKTARNKSQSIYNNNRKKEEIKHELSKGLYNSLKNNPVIWNFIFLDTNNQHRMKLLINEISHKDTDPANLQRYNTTNNNNYRGEYIKLLKESMLPLSKRNLFTRQYGRYKSGRHGRAELMRQWNNNRQKPAGYETYPPPSSAGVYEVPGELQAVADSPTSL